MLSFFQFTHTHMLIMPTPEMPQFYTWTSVIRFTWRLMMTTTRHYLDKETKSTPPSQGNFCLPIMSASTIHCLLKKNVQWILNRFLSFNTLWILKKKSKIFLNYIFNWCGTKTQNFFINNFLPNYFFATQKKINTANIRNRKKLLEHQLYTGKTKDISFKCLS